MKWLCYALLGIALLVYAQTQPLYTLIIVGMFIGGHAFFRMRKKGMLNGIGGGILGKNLGGNSTNNDLVTLLLLQQGFTHGNGKESARSDHWAREREAKLKALDREKQELLSLWED